MQETLVQSLSWEDPLEKEMATHSSILAWRIPWAKEPGGYSPWGHKSPTLVSDLETKPPNHHTILYYTILLPTELFKTLKDDAIKVLHSVGQQIWKTQQWPQDWKRSIFIPIAKKSSTTACANHWTIAPIFHASKVMLKILHARLQQYLNQELLDVQAGFSKGRGTGITLPTES